MGMQSITRDVENRTLTVERLLAAPRNRVWQAWTDSEQLNKWWGPHDWPTTTKSFDFREGGHWHYCMTGPDGTEAWGWLDYRDIIPVSSFEADDSFSDADGNKNDALPHNRWIVRFEAAGGDHDDNSETADNVGSGAEYTRLTAILTFNSEADMQKIIDMGFEGGYSQSLEKLDEYLAQG